ncbi:MAG: hypothetical protein ABJC26_08590 [Gemmatimonadaceae bacterium]
MIKFTTEEIEILLELAKDFSEKQLRKFRSGPDGIDLSGKLKTRLMSVVTHALLTGGFDSDWNATQRGVVLEHIITKLTAQY